jgi:hypothetical protein
VLRAKADRLAIDEGQEQIRITVILCENLTPAPLEPTLPDPVASL